MAKGAVKSAQAAQDNYVNGVQQSADKYLKGAERVTTSPGAAAATPQAMQDYLAGVQKSVTSGKRQRSLGYSTSDWQAAVRAYGASNYAGSTAKGGPKYGRKAQKLQPAWQAARDAAAAVSGPKGKATALAKVSAAMDVMIAVGQSM